MEVFLLPSTAGGWLILGFDFDKLHFLSEEGDSILCPTSEVRIIDKHEEARTYSTRTIFVSTHTKRLVRTVYSYDFCVFVILWFICVHISKYLPRSSRALCTTTSFAG